MEITHKRAFEQPALRQAYLDEIVETAGRKPDFVDSYQYISETDSRRILREQESPIPEDQQIPGAFAAQLENQIRKPSTVYFTEENFSSNVKVLYQNGYPSSDFEITNRTEIMNHETEHAKHYMNGLPGISLDKFNFDNPFEKALFLSASEVIAHGSHIQALGESQPTSDYPKLYQQFLIKEFKRYMGQSGQLLKSGNVNPELLGELQRTTPELRFKAL